MAYDSKRGRVVLFGGYAAGSPLGDTWEFDGERWERKSESGPPPRGALGIAYDSARGKTVLFGGSAGWDRAKFTDTWEWDGTTWARVAVVGPGGETWERDGSTWRRVSAAGPPPRDHHALTYDSERGRIVMFGGSGQLPSGGYPPPESYIWLSDLWEWDGARWTQLAAQGPPSKGGQPGLAYDDHRHRLMLVGGGGGLGGTWVWAGGKWEQIP